MSKHLVPLIVVPENEQPLSQLLPNGVDVVM
jgi:hypothetical protein